MRVAIVMPPATSADPEQTLDGWPSVVHQAKALREHAGLDVMVACRTTLAPATVQRDGVTYRFMSTDSVLVREVAQWNPDVVHVHGFGFTRLNLRLGRALHRQAAIVLQHHGETPGRRRTVLAHRIVRRFVDGYLFTGAKFGQAQPFIDRGMVRETAACYEVLEAASTLPSDSVGSAAPARLAGTPCVLWVGRLIESKDPLAAVAAFAQAAAGELRDAHLHLLATDRSLEPQVRAAIAALGDLGEHVHIHDPVSASEMQSWYQAADIVLSTSWREGSGYALIEAITEGCVPVVTGIPSHRAIVGELIGTFAPGDAPAAAQLMGIASRTSRELVAKHANQTLTWQAVARQLEQAYKLALYSRG
jgi:glycosyltransferase involved in cell wall biosynthesis